MTNTHYTPADILWKAADLIEEFGFDNARSDYNPETYVFDIALGYTLDLALDAAWWGEDWDSETVINPLMLQERPLMEAYLAVSDSMLQEITGTKDKSDGVTMLLFLQEINDWMIALDKQSVVAFLRKTAAEYQQEEQKAA